MKLNDSLLVIVLAQAVLYGTPLLYSALGELLAERSGVLNLGVEGMMLFGAAVGYWVTQTVDGSSATVLMLAISAEEAVKDYAVILSLARNWEQLPTRKPGAIAQLAERLDRTQEVGGSSPPSSIAQPSRFRLLRPSS